MTHSILDYGKNTDKYVVVLQFGPKTYDYREISEPLTWEQAVELCSKLN